MLKKLKYKSYLKQWLDFKKDYVKESTYANYTNIVFNYIIPYLGDYNVNKLNHQIIQKHILYLHSNVEKNLSIKTIKDITSVIKGSLVNAFNKNIIKSFSLNFSYPKVKNVKNKYVLSKYEQNKLMKYVLTNINNKNIGILLSLLSGIRIGELCALKWEDINFEDETIEINKTLQRIYIKDIKCISKIIITPPKSQYSNRIIPLNTEILFLLKKIKGKNNEYVLTNKSKFIEPRLYRIYFETILKKLNIKHFNFHSLRHTFATNCVSLGIDYKTLSEILGHSNVSTTLNLYVHPSIKEKKKCIDSVYNSLTK